MSILNRTFDAESLDLRIDLVFYSSKFQFKNFFLGNLKK